jgi:hypothetical protein
MKYPGHVARMGERRGAYRLLLRRPEGKRPIGSLRYTWKDNIKMEFVTVRVDVREIVYFLFQIGHDIWQCFCKACVGRLLFRRYNKFREN